MNVNKLINNALKRTGIPVHSDVEDNGDEEYIIYNYVSEPFENFSDNIPENDYTNLQLHYFSKKNPHATKKRIANLLFTAGFDVAIGATVFETDTKYYHTVMDIGIDGVIDFTEGGF